MSTTVYQNKSCNTLNLLGLRHLLNNLWISDWLMLPSWAGFIYKLRIGALLDYDIGYFLCVVLIFMIFWCILVLDGTQNVPFSGPVKIKCVCHPFFYDYYSAKGRSWPPLPHRIFGCLGKLGGGFLSLRAVLMDKNIRKFRYRCIVAVIAVFILLFLVGCIRIPFPSKIPIPNKVPIRGWP